MRMRMKMRIRIGIRIRIRIGIDIRDDGGTDHSRTFRCVVWGKALIMGTAYVCAEACRERRRIYTHLELRTVGGFCW